MYISKSFIGAVANAIIWFAAAFVLFKLSTDISWPRWAWMYFAVTTGVGLSIAYSILRRLERNDVQRSQSRIDRILTSLDDAELDALRDRLSGGMMGDGEYGSLDDLLMENAAKPKRR